MTSNASADSAANSNPETSVVALLEALEESARKGEDLSLDGFLHIAGHRFSGPIFLIPGLIALSPLSGIPLVPSFLGLVISLICVQLIFGRRHLWFPAWVQTRALDADRVQRMTRFIKKPARFLDQVTRPRLVWLTQGLALRLAATLCLLTALSMPLLEILPFTSTLAGAVISLFGLSLTTRDGLLMLFALLFVGGLMGLGANLLTG